MIGTKVAILGANNSALSMLFEILEAIPDKITEVEIVVNKAKTDFSPFHVSSINAKEINIEDWIPGIGDQYFLGVYKPESKKIVFEIFHSRFGIEKFSYLSIFHPFTSIASSAIIQNGVIINPGSVLAPYCKLGNYVSVNRQVSIGHHTQIGDFTTINPGTNIAGHCSIGDNVLIGMGSVIIDNVKVGSNSIIGAGSLVTKDVPENVVVYGSPAKVIR
jgi:sugar O-acyltransferase (sialic acid O-acetyltransferase NeuD family)